jgi:branched-chain amino acid transport system substrate-binding protein
MQHSSTRTLAILTLAGAVALTGCGSSSKSKSGGLGAAPSSAAGGSAAAGASGGTVKIGFEGPLSGDNQQLGINEVNAVQVAVDEANKNNTYGFQVALVKADDVGLPDKAPAAAAVLQGDNSVIGVVGPSFSGASKAVAPSYGAAKLVLVSPSATNPDLTKQGFTAFHRVVPPDSLEGLEAADWLAKKAKNVYIVDDATDYGKGAADAVQAELTIKKVKFTRDSVPQATTDYSVASQKIASSGADALFYGGYDTQAGQFAKALTAAGFKGLTMTGNGGKSSKFTAAAGPSGDGWYFSCGCLDATVAPVAAAFNAAYKARWNTDPSTYSPEAFDATNALLTAIKAAGGAKATRAQVFDAVNALDYKGITTQIKFDKTGEVEQQVINLYQQKAGKIALLGDIKNQS